MKTTSQKTNQNDHMDALCNLMTLLAMLCRATLDGWVMESSDKKWSTGEENDKLLQYFCLENSINNMKRQRDMKLEMSPSSQQASNMLLGKSREIALEKRLSQSKNNDQLWMFLVVKVKSNAVKKHIVRNLEC